MNKFVFSDSSGKRKRRLFELAKYSLLILWLVSFIFYHSYNSTPVVNGENAKADVVSDLKVIDEISAKKEDVIEVIGVGPLVNTEKGEDGYFLSRNGFQNDRQVMLTFDDGPDPYYTPKILDILKENKVKGVFFIIGEHMMRYPEITRRIVNEGHEIGLHSMTHPYEDDSLYHDIKLAEREIDVPQKIFIAQTGLKTNIFRVPNWGAEDTISLNSLVLEVFAKDKGYDVISSTIDSHDWKETDVNIVVNNATGLMTSQVILLHDGGGNRQVTIDALPLIINHYKDRGFDFITVDDLKHPYSHSMVTPTYYESFISNVTYAALWIERNYFGIYMVIFKTSLGVAMIGMILTVVFATLQVIRKQFKTEPDVKYRPCVSVVVPAFNEEKSIQNTIKAILNSDYYDFEVIVVNNNSTDATVGKLDIFKGDTRFRVAKETKQGKYNALNKGFKLAKGNIVVAIDADTVLYSDAISKMISYFTEENITSVAGNIKIGNLNSTLTRLQAIEYIVGLNLDRRAYDLFGSVPVVPGAFGAWRKRDVIQAGGYRNDTLAEDAELALRLLRKGKKIVYADDAIGYTEAPTKLKQWLKQRERWTFGILQIMYKNRDMYFKSKYGFVGVFLLPYMGGIQLVFMLLAPVFDIAAIITLFIYPQIVIYYFLIFVFINLILASIAFAFEKEKKTWLLLYIPILRVYYQVLWYSNLYRCVYKAIIGKRITWNKLEHKGLVGAVAEESLGVPTEVVKVK